jgi:hypothetical protein
MNAVDSVVEAVIGLINSRSLFAQVTRGALPTHEGITCEVGPSVFSSMHMDKNLVIPLDLTINAKHPDLRTLTDTMYAIHSYLTFKKSYPKDEVGGEWQILDIVNGTLPQLIGREDNNDWMMASSLTVKFYWKGDED